MVLTSLVAFAALVTKAAPTRDGYVDKIEVTISTGADDLRSDSGAMIVLMYSNGHHQVQPIKRPDESFGGNTSKTVTITPNERNLRMQDIYQIRVDFSSGKATGFDDHWSLAGVSVKASAGADSIFLYNNQKLGMHLQYTQHWMSPFFASATVPDMINPADLYATIEGAAGPPAQANLHLDLETDDGRAWRGQRSGSMIADERYPGARVESNVNDRIPVQSIRALRIGYSNGGAWDMRSVRFQYKDSRGNIVEFASFNEVNVRFNGGGWWQAPVSRRMKRPTGVPITAMSIEVLTGADDLRRLDLPQSQADHYNSKPDITFAFPLLNNGRYANWFMTGDNVRHILSRTQPMIEQDGDEFPAGWTGRFGSWGSFTKNFIAVGTPYIHSSDIQNVTVKFHQGQGGNIAPTQSSGGGLIGDLRAADQWDLQGIIITVQGATGPSHRIYSNFAINQRMNREGQTWKSPNFETLLLRRFDSGS